MQSGTINVATHRNCVFILFFNSNNLSDTLIEQSQHMKIVHLQQHPMDTLNLVGVSANTMHHSPLYVILHYN